MPRRYADWRDWFRPQPAVVLEQLSPQEAKVISAWRLTLPEWHSLASHERAQLRFDYLKAPGFVA